MRRVTIGLAQMRVGKTKSENLKRAASFVASASRDGAQIVCLPELFATPYFPRMKTSNVEPETIPGPTSAALSKVARENRVVLVGGSVFEVSATRRFNTSMVFDERGRLLGKYRKVHVPSDPGFYEQDYFDPGQSYCAKQTRFGKVGTLICFDQWYPEAARATRLLGAEMVFYPTAIGTVRGIEQSEGSWKDAWEAVQRGHAIANSVVVAAANRVGKEGDTDFWGGSFVCDQFGKVLARAGPKETVLIAECDLDLGTEVEQGWGFIKNRRPETYRRLVE